MHPDCATASRSASARSATSSSRRPLMPYRSAIATTAIVSRGCARRVPSGQPAMREASGLTSAPADRPQVYGRDMADRWLEPPDDLRHGAPTLSEIIELQGRGELTPGKMRVRGGQLARAEINAILYGIDDPPPSEDKPL